MNARQASAGHDSAGRGERLYALVETYAGLGDHHTGTPVDDSTRAWFARELDARGARVTSHEYTFERFAATARVFVGHRELEALPVHYSGLGEVDTVDPFVGEVAIARGFGAHLDEVLGEARAEGYRAAVLATAGAGGRLVAANRLPVPPPGPIAVLAAGAELDALRAGPVRVTVDAAIVPGASATVMGRLGRGRRDPVVVTTPLTGWFACAGERGTGIAVALDLAEALAADGPVDVVGTTGHELGHLGARNYVRRGELAPGAVIHLGASVAAGDPGPEGVPHLGSIRFAFLDGPPSGELTEVLGSVGLAVRAGGGPWPGEGEEWRHLGAPVLSIVGGFDRFHTPDDVPAEVTSPALLERVADAIREAAGLLVA